MVEQNFWELLQAKRPELTKSGSLVADFLSEHAEDAQYLSISSLAKACDVAEATIFRFCRQLGFRGYNEMKISLAQANATPGPLTDYTLEPTMDTNALCERANAAFQAAINGTMTVLDTQAIEKAALLLQAAETVYCLGQGGSMMLANDIWVRLATISNKFRTCGDSHMQLLSASHMGPSDVILFISYSGATRDMMETLRVAKGNGAKVILLTHYDDAPGTALADVVLLCGAKESPLESGSIPVKAAVLFVAEVLVLRYTLNDKTLISQSQEKASQVMSSKFYEAEENHEEL